MDACPFCHAAWIRTTRCRCCGWGPHHWPYQTPAWEQRLTAALTLSWLETFWVLATTPRFFFQRLDSRRAPWGAFAFAGPVLLLAFLFSFCHLPSLLAANPEVGRLLSEARLEEALVRLAALGPLERTMHLGADLVIMWLQWSLFLAGVAAMLQIGIRLSLGRRAPWRLVARVLGYTAVPGVICTLTWFAVTYILSKNYCGYLPAGESWLIGLAGSLGSLTCFLAMFLWPYSLLLTGLEETLGVSRFRAQVAVLAGTAIGFGAFAVVGVLLSALA